MELVKICVPQWTLVGILTSPLRAMAHLTRKLIKVIVTSDNLPTYVARHGAALIAHHLVAASLLDKRVVTLWTLAHKRVGHSLLDCVPSV